MHCSLRYSNCMEQSLVHSRWSVNICVMKMNETTLISVQEEASVIFKWRWSERQHVGLEPLGHGDMSGRGLRNQNVHFLNYKVCHGPLISVNWHQGGGLLLNSSASWKPAWVRPVCKSEWTFPKPGQPCEAVSLPEDGTRVLMVASRGTDIPKLSISKR